MSDGDDNRDQNDLSEHRDGSGGDEEFGDGFTGETMKTGNVQYATEQSAPATKKKKSTARLDPTRRDPDQEQIHYFAKIMNDPGNELSLDFLDRKLKAKVIKFLEVEEKLHNFCKEHNFNYEEPSNESDFSRRQRVKCRINYHLNKPKKNKKKR